MHFYSRLHLANTIMFLNKKMKIMKMKIGILGLFLIGLLTISMWPNTVKVKGVVTNEIGEKLIGASIIEVGTNNGTTSDIEGEFELEVKSTTGTLEVMYLGFERKIVKLKDVDLSEPLQIKMMNEIGLVEELEIVEFENKEELLQIEDDITFEISVFNQGSISDMASSSKSKRAYIPSPLPQILPCLPSQLT